LRDFAWFCVILPQAKPPFRCGQLPHRDVAHFGFRNNSSKTGRTSWVALPLLNGSTAFPESTALLFLPSFASKLSEMPPRGRPSRKDKGKKRLRSPTPDEEVRKMTRTRFGSW
jgi:hypothetical protein